MEIPGGHDYIAELAPPVEFRPERSCLLLVDLQLAAGSRDAGLGRVLARQGRLAEAEYRYSRIERLVRPNARRLLDAFRAAGLRRAFVTYGSEVSDYSDLQEPMRSLCVRTGNRAGAPEHELLPELAPRDDERVFNKITLSPFASTPLELVLRGWGVETLVVCGLTTNMCVEHTVRDGADRGFGCVLVEDACATDSPPLHESALRVVSRLYGSVATTDGVLAAIGAEAAA